MQVANGDEGRLKVRHFVYKKRLVAQRMST